MQNEMEQQWKLKGHCDFTGGQYRDSRIASWWFGMPDPWEDLLSRTPPYRAQGSGIAKDPGECAAGEEAGFRA